MNTSRIVDEKERKREIERKTKPTLKRETERKRKRKRERGESQKRKKGKKKRRDIVCGVCATWSGSIKTWMTPSFDPAGLTGTLSEPG